MIFQINLKTFTIILLILLLSLCISFRALGDFSKTWELSSKSIVSVLPTWPGYNKPGFGAPSGTAPEGSGIIIGENGLILTASHVISRATEVLVRDINGKKYEAKVILNDINTDLAVLKTDIKNEVIKINKSRPKTGSSVCLVSNAFGLGINITCGVVSMNKISGIGFNDNEDFIQIDAAANPGSSGGGVVNLKGELIGLMSGIFTKETDTNAGVNFAISSELILNTIKDVLK